MANVKWGVLGTADIARGQTIPAMLLITGVLTIFRGREAEKQ